MKNRSVYKIARAIKENIANAVPWEMTFINLGIGDPAAQLTAIQKEAVQKIMKENFERWAGTWIVPLADEILRKKQIELKVVR